MYYTVVWLLGEDGEALDEVKSDDLTAAQKHAVIVGHQAVDMCEAAYKKRNPDSTAKPSR